MYNCVWSETSLDADNRSHYGLATLVNNTLDKANLGFVHRNGFTQLPREAEGAVVIIHGGHQVGSAGEVIGQINRLSWAVVIVIGDETALFPTDRLRGPRRKVWVQMPVPGRHDLVDRKLICSHPNDAVAHLQLREKERRERPYDWSFAGQVNHVNRRTCVQQLKMLHNGYLYESPRFWNGLSREEYYRVMASSKIVMCPTGAATPDTMRVAEALEFGCVPIVEDRYPPGYPRNAGPGMTGYWRYALGEEPPFTLLTDWRELPSLFDWELRTWADTAKRLGTWWENYKERMCRWLEEDVRVVAG